MARGQKVPLDQEIRNHLLTILRDVKAPATARAHAARTLLDLDRAGMRDSKSPGEMTAEEIDAELKGNPSDV